MNKMMMGQMPAIFRFWWLIELLVFIAVGYWIGFGWAFLIIIVSCVLGLLLIRARGFNMMQQVKKEPLSGAFMLMQSLENSFVILSGFLLLIPGLLTTVLGLLCLLPPFRRRLIRKVLGFNVSDFTKGFAGASTNTNQAANDNDSNPSGNTIDGEYWREEKSAEQIDTDKDDDAGKS